MPLSSSEEAKMVVFPSGISKGVVYFYNKNAKNVYINRENAVQYLLGEHFYGNGRNWNGLRSVSISADKTEGAFAYQDDVPIEEHTNMADIKVHIQAVNFPEEFMPCIGETLLDDGVSIAQQDRSIFGLSYVTNPCEAFDGLSYDYEIHIIYGMTAGVTQRQFITESDNQVVLAYNWDCETVPEPFSDPLKIPSAELVIRVRNDKGQDYLNKIAYIEDCLYGTENSEPFLPMPDDIIEIIDPYPEEFLLHLDGAINFISDVVSHSIVIGNANTTVDSTINLNSSYEIFGELLRFDRLFLDHIFSFVFTNSISGSRLNIAPKEINNITTLTFSEEIIGSLLHVYNEVINSVETFVFSEGIYDRLIHVFYEIINYIAGFVLSESAYNNMIHINRMFVNHSVIFTSLINADNSRIHINAKEVNSIDNFYISTENYGKLIRVIASFAESLININSVCDVYGKLINTISECVNELAAIPEAVCTAYGYLPTPVYTGQIGLVSFISSSDNYSFQPSPHDKIVNFTAIFVYANRIIGRLREAWSYPVEDGFLKIIWHYSASVSGGWLLII